MSSTPLIFNITKAGYQTSLDQQNFGLQVKLSKLVFGTGHYESVDDDLRTTLDEPAVEANLTAGGLVELKNQLILGLNFVPDQKVEVSEIGIYTTDNILFAVASKPAGEFFTLNPDVALVSSFALALGQITNVTVVLQNDAPIFQQMMFNHEMAPDPHPQYATDNDLHDANVYNDNTFLRKSQVINHLDSTSPSDPLSAHMGKVLRDSAAWRVFFGQTSTSIVDGDNGNTYIRLLDGNLNPSGGSTRVYGIGNIEVFSISGELRISGKLNDTLTSTATDQALTAYQGKVLSDRIDNLSTYIWNNVNDNLNKKYDKAGGTISGDVRIEGNITRNRGTLISRWFSVRSGGVDQGIGLDISTQANYTSFMMTNEDGSMDGNALFAFNGRIAATNLITLGSDPVDVTGARWFNTIYVNNNPSWLIVSAAGEGYETDQNDGLRAYVNGRLVQGIYGHTSGANHYQSFNFFLLVPPWKSYEIRCNRNKWYWIEYL